MATVWGNSEPVSIILSINGMILLDIRKEMTSSLSVYESEFNQLMTGSYGKYQDLQRDLP